MRIGANAGATRYKNVERDSTSDFPPDKSFNQGPTIDVDEYDSTSDEDSDMEYDFSTRAGRPGDDYDPEEKNLDGSIDKDDKPTVLVEESAQATRARNDKAGSKNILKSR